jgi:hypothetical protein
MDEDENEREEPFTVTTRFVPLGLSWIVSL